LIILCTHNNGGVGKTTLAIHAAGALINSKFLFRVLLVDCDDQADFWQFHTGDNPEKDKNVIIEDTTTLIWNKTRTSIKKLVTPSEYDHAVLDIDSPLQNTVQVILGNNPNLILIPVNKSQKIKSLRNLPRILEVISQIKSKFGFLPKVVIIPLGISKDDVLKVVDSIEPSSKPKDYQIADEMPDVQEKMQQAIYDDRKYIWDYEGYEYIYDYFCNILEI
jgi:chromosome partitioning protein